MRQKKGLLILTPPRAENIFRENRGGKGATELNGRIDAEGSQKHKEERRSFRLMAKTSNTNNEKKRAKKNIHAAGGS